MQRNSGITLIETLSVLAIMLLMGLLAIPALNLFRSQSALKYSARNIQCLFQEARSMAISQGQNMLVEIRGDNDSAAIWDQAKTNLMSKRWYAPAAVDILDVNMQDMQQPPNPTKFFDVLFKPNGSANRDISIYIKLRSAPDNDTTKYYTVTLINVTGFANIYPRKQ